MAFKIQGTVAVLPAASKADANVVGAVELHLIVAAVEFGRVDGEFASGCGHAECAIAGGLYSLVFAMVAVVVVTAALVIHFDVVGVFGTEVDFVAADEGAAALLLLPSENRSNHPGK